MFLVLASSSLACLERISIWYGLCGQMVRVRAQLVLWAGLDNLRQFVVSKRPSIAMRFHDSLLGQEISVSAVRSSLPKPAIFWSARLDERLELLNIC